MKVAFLGLGSMGAPMALRVLRAGHELVVWNRTASRAEPLRAAGAAVAASAAEAVGSADVAITMLADDAAVAEVVLGGAGIVAALPTRSVHASMSTISVDLSRRLAAAHGERGQGYVAAPVFGRPQAVEAGKLTVLSAGPAEARERCRSVFDALAPVVQELGDEAPAANVVKLAGNFLIASMLEALSEAFALGRKYEIAPARLLEILNGNLVRSPLYESYGTLMVEERFEPAGFKLKLGMKDMRLALAAAEEAGAPMPLASLVHDHFLSGVARGWGDRDWAAMAAVVAETAGL